MTKQLPPPLIYDEDVPNFAKIICDQFNELRAYLSQLQPEEGVDPVIKYLCDQIVCIGCGLKKNVCKESCNWYTKPTTTLERCSHNIVIPDCFKCYPVEQKEPVTPESEIKKFLSAHDFKGLAEAFAKGDIEWHAKEWEDFIAKLRLSTLSQFKEKLREELPDLSHAGQTEQQIIEDDNFPMIERGIVIERVRIRNLITNIEN